METLPPIILILTKSDLLDPVEGTLPIQNPIILPELQDKAAKTKCRDVE